MYIWTTPNPRTFLVSTYLAKMREYSGNRAKFDMSVQQNTNANKREVIIPTTSIVHEDLEPQNIYTGDVEQTLVRFQEQVRNEPNAAILYSALDALALHPTWANTRGYNVPMQGDDAEPSGPKDTKERVVTATRTERRDENKRPTESSTTNETTHRRGNLRAHAKSMAFRVITSVKRLTNFFEAGTSNMRWTTAVARAIMAIPKWRDSSWEIVKGNRALVQLWATRKEELSEDLAEEDTVSELEGLSTKEALTKVEESVLGKAEEHNIRIGLAAPIVYNCYAQSRQAVNDTCLYCLLFEWCNHQKEDITYQLYANLRADIDVKTLRALEAMARAHNREMHSTNGNISVPLPKNARPDQAFALITEYFNQEPLEITSSNAEPAALLAECERVDSY